MDEEIKEDRYDHKSLADQFRAEMDVQGEECHSIGICVNEEGQYVELVQPSTDQVIDLIHPKIMRHLAAALIMVAEEWERGELEGLEAKQ